MADSAANPVAAAPAAPCLLVTRPEPQAGEWVQRLQALGWPAQALPLLHIGPPPAPQAVQAMARALQPGELVMFVSPNAVAQSLAVWPEGLAWPAGVRAAATGPGTVAALLAAGVPPGQIVAPGPETGQFDSEALWAHLRAEPWVGRRVWIVRGEGGRDWFADTLRAAGAQVQTVQGYVRGGPRLDAASKAVLARALAHPRQVLWLFSSSEALDHLAALAPAADWSAAQAVATHPRIAERALALGVGQVHQVQVGLSALDAWLRQHVGVAGRP